MSPSAVSENPPMTESYASTKSTKSNMDNLQIAAEAPTDADQLWWWLRCAPLLQTLLKHTGSYTPEQLEDHLNTFRDVVIPSFGPPTPSSKAIPLLGSDGSPFEPSWNFTQERSVIRYAFEPVSKEAGTDEDIFGSNGVPSMVTALSKAASDVDMLWFCQVMNAWFVFGDEAVKAKAAMPSHMLRVPQCFLGFDMKGGKRHLKAYFFPIHKHFATGISTEQLTYDLVRNLQPCGEQFLPAVQKLEKYLSKCTILRPVEMIAIDCLDPFKSKPRVKVYARSNSVALSVLRNGVTLGGLQSGEKTIKAMETLEKIWHILLDEPQGMTENQNKEPLNVHPLHQGICFVFEMRPGSEHIDVKVHVPFGNYHRKDLDAVRDFTAALGVLGFVEGAERYASGVVQTAKLPGQNYNKQGGTAYFAYNYGEEGSYLSSYFSPLCMRQ